MRLAILLFCSVVVFGQSTAPPPEQRAEPPAGSPDQKLQNKDSGLGTGADGRMEGPVEILSDTQGVDFGPYLQRVYQEVRDNWYRLIPESVERKKGKLALEFAIMKDGSVHELRIVASSGDPALDRPAPWDGSFSAPERLPQSDALTQESPATPGNKPGEDSKNQPSDEELRRSKPADFNRDIYYKNKLEFSLDGGWLPINIPFPLDVFLGDPYNLYPLHYTLVPIIASLRWHMDDMGGPWILRGNWDLTVSGSATAIPRGAETRYFSYIMGIRRNFVPRNWRIVPYWDLRLGLGDIDAKGPEGVPYAQGQDFTFTANMGSGARYNFNPRYAISAGLNYMHISNAALSGVKTNYGINVLGPMFGIDIQVRRHRRHSEQ